MEKMQGLTNDGMKLFYALDQLRKLEVAVGFQRGKDPYSDGTDLVDVAAQNEFGTSDIPARPFMRQSWKNNDKAIKQVVKNVIAAVEQGQNISGLLNQVGVYGVGLVQDEIREGNFVPNAPATIKMKGSDRPLIDTGHMRQSVHYVIRERK